MDRDHPAALDDAALRAQCVVERGRGSGPGGQHRNKVETRVTIRHVPTGLRAQAGERRQAAENARVALFRLRLELATRVRRPFGPEPSPMWRARVDRDGRIACNPSHRDFPALLAEALDAIEASGLDPARAAARLGCTTTQLIRFVQLHAPAFVQWNHRRAELGLYPLR